MCICYWCWNDLSNANPAVQNKPHVPFTDETCFSNYLCIILHCMDLQLNFLLTLSPTLPHSISCYSLLFISFLSFLCFNSFQLKNTSALKRLSGRLSCSDSKGSHLPYNVLSTHLQSALPFKLLKESMLEKEICNWQIPFIMLHPLIC